MTTKTETETDPIAAFVAEVEADAATKDTPASRFREIHLSPSAVEFRLRAAMVRAGLDPEGITVTSVVDNTDSWASHDGLRVSSPDAATRARAVRWLVTYLRPRVERYRSLSRLQAAIYRADEETGVVLFRRWPLGD